MLSTLHDPSGTATMTAKSISRPDQGLLCGPKLPSEVSLLSPLVLLHWSVDFSELCVAASFQPEFPAMDFQPAPGPTSHHGAGLPLCISLLALLPLLSGSFFSSPPPVKGLLVCFRSSTNCSAWWCGTLCSSRDRNWPAMSLIFDYLLNLYRPNLSQLFHPCELIDLGVNTSLLGLF